MSYFCLSYIPVGVAQVVKASDDFTTEEEASACGTRIAAENPGSMVLVYPSDQKFELAEISSDTVYGKGERWDIRDALAKRDELAEQRIYTEVMASQ